MNWSKAHLKKIRKLIKEWHVENNAEEFFVVAAISTSKKRDYYFERHYYTKGKRYDGHYCTTVIGGDQFYSLKES